MGACSGACFAGSALQADFDRDQAVSESGSCLLAKDAPCDIWPQFFAANDRAARPRFALDSWALIGGDAVLQPRLDGLIPMVFDVEDASRLTWPTKDCDSSHRGGLSGLEFGLHTPEYTQDFLSTQRILALQGKSQREKLTFMSIHDAIKARRAAVRLSQKTLADRVNALQPDEKPISRQTVQHWENGTTAPKRTRLPAVAAALETTAEALLAGRSVDIDFSEPGDARVDAVAAALSEIKALDPQRFDQLAANVTALLRSMRTTDELLRSEHGITGYTSPARAQEKLGVPKSSPSAEGGLIGGMSGFGELQEAEDEKKARKG